MELIHDLDIRINEVLESHAEMDLAWRNIVREKVVRKIMSDVYFQNLIHNHVLLIML